MEAEEIIDDNFTDDLCGDIYNLSATLSTLLSIDSRLLGEKRNGRLHHMKKVIFDTLAIYVDCLSTDEAMIENADEDIADYNGEEDEY